MTARQEEGASGGACGRWHHRRLEDCTLLGTGQDVGVIQFLHAAVDVAEASSQRPLAEHIDDRGDRQRQKGEEEVHDVLVYLCSSAYSTWFALVSTRSLIVRVLAVVDILGDHKANFFNNNKKNDLAQQSNCQFISSHIYIARCIITN
jgi:hypothetical protein